MRVAIIPAKGISKRIQRKNIKNFCGKPLISYPLLELKKTDIFNRVIVSTDDDEIAEIAKEYGAEVPFIRPSNLSDDMTGTSKVIAHAIQEVDRDNKIEYVCCVYPTTPMLNIDDIENACHQLVNSEKSFVFSATQYSYPAERAFYLDENNEVKMLFPKNYEKRSQDLKNVYHDAGQFYWGTKQAWLDNELIFGDKSSPHILPHYRVQDIDTEDDWKRAEQIYLSTNETK